VLRHAAVDLINSWNRWAIVIPWRGAALRGSAAPLQRARQRLQGKSAAADPTHGAGEARPARRLKGPRLLPPRSDRAEDIYRIVSSFLAVPLEEVCGAPPLPSLRAVPAATLAGARAGAVRQQQPAAALPPSVTPPPRPHAPAPLQMAYAELLWLDRLGMYIRCDVQGKEPAVVRVPFYR
jgi:hypothetical protein